MEREPDYTMTVPLMSSEEGQKTIILLVDAPEVQFDLVLVNYGKPFPSAFCMLVLQVYKG